MSRLTAFSCAALLSLSPAAFAADAALVEAATEEGAVSVYTSTDISQARGLLDAFAAKYPGIRIDYNDVGTNGAYNRVIAEAAARQMGGDVIWSSAMDLQMKLAADGYLDAYASPEADVVPDWGKYQDMLYATTIEPVGIIYNKLSVSEDKVPHTRAELIAFLADPEVSGMVATFDPEKSGSGFLFHTNDALQTTDFWELAAAFSAARGKTYSSTGSVKETVVSGENVLAFNIIGSYGIEWAKEIENLGVAFTTDHTAGFSRVAGIPKDAPHPAAARLFVDFMLSPEGQGALAAADLPSVRTDIEGGLDLDGLNEVVGGNLRPIVLDEALLDYMSPMKRVDFLKQWKAAGKS